MLKIFRGGVNTPHRKNTEESKTLVMDIPSRVIIPMVQHIEPLYTNGEKGDLVAAGQVIGNSEAYVSAPVHASVSGTVTRVEPMLYASGKQVMSVEIQTDGNQDVDENTNLR